MEVFDRQLAMKRAGGDAERLSDRLEDFQIQLPARQNAMAKAVTSGRAQRLADLARELRESAHGIAAEGLAALAEQIERAAHEGALEDVPQLLTHMEMESDWLSRILDENRCSGNL